MAPITRKKKAGLKEEYVDSEDSRSATVAQPKSKKAKPSTGGNESNSTEKEKEKKKKKTRVGSGKLRHLMLMPVDIFAEVCLHLNPRDLRTLSLTTRRLRTILMSRDSKHIWKACLSAVTIPGLPETPSDLSEPQYVRLMLTNECYDCGVSCGMYDYYHRVRYCVPCFQKNLTGETEFSDVDDDMWQLVELCSSGSLFNLCRCKEELQDRVLHRKSCLDLLREITNALAMTSSDNYESELNRWKDMLKAKHLMRIATGRAMYKWKRAEAASKQDVRDAVKDQHFASVKAKLFELGWTESDLPSIRNPRFDTLVRKPKRLTENAWLKIAPKLEEMLQAEQRDRLETAIYLRRWARRRQLKARYTDFVEATFGPERSGISTVPDSEQFIAQSPIKQIFANTQNEGITDEEWESLRPDVLLWVLKYKRDVHRLYAGVLDGKSLDLVIRRVPSNLRMVDDDSKADKLANLTSEIDTLMQRLSLATSVFQCELCRMVSWFLEFDSASGCSHVLNNPKMAVQAMLRYLDQDPLSATFKDMEDVTLMLKCMRCDERVAPFQSFSSLVTHYLENELLHARAKADLPADYTGILHNMHDLDDDMRPLVCALELEGGDTVETGKGSLIVNGSFEMF